MAPAGTRYLAFKLFKALLRGFGRGDCHPEVAVNWQ